MKKKIKKWIAKKLYIWACKIDYEEVEEWQKMQRTSIKRWKKLRKHCSEKLATLINFNIRQMDI